MKEAKKLYLIATERRENPEQAAANDAAAAAEEEAAATAAAAVADSGMPFVCVSWNRRTRGTWGVDPLYAVSRA